MIARRTGCFTGPKHGILITCLSVFLTFSIPCKALSSGSAAKNLRKSIGQKDAALLADPAGAILFSMNRDKSLIPASTLKILTALVGLRYLGPDFRFRTDFFLNDQSDLTIKGYGDPFLVSETVAQIAGIISRHVQRYDTLVLDEYLLDPTLNHGDYKRDLVGAIAFDRENSILYLIERMADEYRSVIHVWEISR